MVKNKFSPNLEGEAQKMLGLLYLFDVLDVFGRKSKSKVPRAFIVGAKWVPIEVNNAMQFRNHHYATYHTLFTQGPLSLSTSIKCEGCNFPLCQSCHGQTSDSRKFHTDQECKILSKCKQSEVQL